jgi:hypothetical protein
MVRPGGRRSLRTHHSMRHGRPRASWQRSSRHASSSSGHADPYSRSEGRTSGVSPRHHSDRRHRRYPAMSGGGPRRQVRHAGSPRVRRLTRLPDRRGCRARSWRRLRVEVVTPSPEVASRAQESTGGVAKAADARAAHWRPAAMKGGVRWARAARAHRVTPESDGSNARGSRRWSAHTDLPDRAGFARDACDDLRRTRWGRRRDTPIAARPGVPRMHRMYRCRVGLAYARRPPDGRGGRYHPTAMTPGADSGG